SRPGARTGARTSRSRRRPCETATDAATTQVSRKGGPIAHPFSLLTAGPTRLRGLTGSVPEVPHAREEHRDAVPVARLDALLVLRRAARLDDRGDSGRGRRVDVVREREERV